MDFVTVRTLRDKSGEIWNRVEAGEEFVITRNGKPFALLVHTAPQAVESRLRALRRDTFRAAWAAMTDQAQAGGAAAELGDDHIQAQVDAARRERCHAPGLA